MITKFIFCIGLLCPFYIKAQLRLPAIFSDNMVLQRNVQAPVWGVAAPGETIQINFRGKSYHCITKADGKWMTTISVGSHGGPFTLSIRTTRDSLIFNNILTGEVWVCSGQSNMEMPMQGWPNGDGTYRFPVLNSKEEIAKSTNPNIRLLQLAPAFHTSEQNDMKVVGESWRECSPKSTPEFSSTAYYFAQEVYNKTKIPIGLIQSAVGGTTIELWSNKEALLTSKDFKDQMQRLNGVKVGGKRTPASLFNAMIAPLIPFAIRGVLWYQGEFNASRAYQYMELFPKMIRAWRQRWGQGNFPFFYVQLPIINKKDTFSTHSEWAELREAQFQTLHVPNTAMAVTIDLPDNDLHPANKKDFSHRLALIALHRIYHGKNGYSGPLYKSYTVKSGVISVQFSNPEVGLQSKDGKSLNGFYIAGSDSIFHAASAIIKGSRIQISNPAVLKPIAVRYNWADWPLGNLCSKDELPASPFRTDDWEMFTSHAESQK